MPGGLLQLVAYGAQDAYLSGNPQITFWKGLYKRHTNFAIEPFRINFTGQPAWGTKQTAIIGRHADLLYKTYVEVQLPYLGTDGNAFEWNNEQGRLGYNLLDYVELDIGGQIIDKQYSEFMFLWDSLTSDIQTSAKLWAMVGKGKAAGASTLDDTTGCSTQPATGRPVLPNTLYIPLFFFFTRNPGLALPLISLQYHEVKINVQWNQPKTIAGSFLSADVAKLPQATSAAMYIDYIYLDTEERRRFAQQSHEYLIEQVQFNEDQGISSANQRIDLTFNHPVKELIWVVQPHSYTDCSAAAEWSDTRLRPFTYDSPAVYEQWIQFNGQDRLDRRYGDYYNKVQPYQYHTGLAGGCVGASGQEFGLVSQPGVYVYSFALKPEEHQPTGTCNFSRIDTATIVMNLSGAITVADADSQGRNSNWDVRVYATNYNILRIMSGMGGLAYSN
jgi:hypothetical protein